jgi:3-oxoacyl-[acyl-carrier-protein] synthase-3
MTGKLPIRFAGTGSYLPEQVITNKYFVDYLDTSEEWIVTRTGIHERRWASKGESTSTMAAEAAKLAIEDAGMTPNDIDVIVCATATGDCQFPATATFVQQALALGEVPAFDISAACAGFIHATVVASGMLGAGIYKNALVIGAETLSRFIDPEDRATCILLGDGAGAAVLRRSDNPEQAVLHASLGCDGSKSKLIWVPAGGSQLPASEMTVAERLHFMKMRGREVYKFAVNKMQAVVDEALEVTGLKPSDLKLVIPHQSNLRIIESVRQKLELPKEKIAININRYGNTSAASVPTAFDEARRNGTLEEGDYVLMLAIGAGLTWGVMVVRL